MEEHPVKKDPDAHANSGQLALHPGHQGGMLGPDGLAINKEKKTYQLDTSTFLTGVNQAEKGPKRIDESLPKATEINFYHSRLNDVINDLGLKVAGVIKDHENDFFVAFKNKMYAIMKEMKELKEKASSERHKAKQEARLVNLEKERDWFRREALKLDRMCKDHKKILNKLKSTLENIEEDRDFFQEQLFNAKKVNKALLMEVEKYKNVLISSQGQEALSSLQLQYQQPLAITHQEQDLQSNDDNTYSNQKAKKQTTIKLRQRIDDALKSSQPSDFQEFMKGEEGSKLLYGNQIDDENEDLDDDRDNVVDYKFNATSSLQSKQKKTQHNEIKHQIQDKISQSQQTVSMEEYRKIVRENAELKDKELKYVDTIKHLKNQIDMEKKNARSLRADKVNFTTQRNELEEFFLQCIEEVRKDIVKRKTVSSNYSTKKNLQRSTSTASMKLTGSQQQQQQYQEEQQQQQQSTKLDNFTATDKRKVIELLMSNENVLLFLYEKLFPSTSMSTQSTQSRGQTGFSQNNILGSGSQYKFVTDSGGNPNRSQTTIAGSRLNVNKNPGGSGVGFGFGNGGLAPINMNSIQHYGQSTGQDYANNNGSLPLAGGLGMSIQNNIQNINLNINLAKAGYGSQPFIPGRGGTAPIGQNRSKKGYQTHINALTQAASNNKYVL